MKYVIFSVLALVVVLLNSCIDGEEEVWIRGDGSARIKAVYHVPGVLFSAEDATALVKSIHDEMQKEESIKVITNRVERKEGYRVITIELETDDMMGLDEALSNREMIKAKLKDSIIDDVADWGVTVKSVEIQDINPSGSMQDSMERQAAAERERRAIETTAEGNKNAAILEAQGKLEASKLEAQAQVALANASAKAMQMIAQATDGKELPAMFLLGDRYINTLEKMTQSPNSKFVIYPADIQGAIKGMLGSALKK